MLNAGQAGLADAPVTKSLMLLCTAGTLGTSILSSTGRTAMSFTAIFRQLELQRLVTQNLPFTTPGELLFGMILVYYFRLFERQWGSAQFAAMAIITSAISTAIQLCFIGFFNSGQRYQSVQTFASGPYWHIFACFVCFFLDTPPLYKFEILGAFTASDKMFVYLAGLQLVLSNPSRSLNSSVCGLLAGVLYRTPLLGLSKISMPSFAISFCSTFIAPLLTTGPTRSVPGSTLGDGEDVNTSRSSSGRPLRGIASGGATAGATTGATDFITTTEPSEENVAWLTQMGFSRERAVDALRRTTNDAQEAAELLLQ